MKFQHDVITISEICMVVITVFIVLAYFKGWG